MGNIFRSGRYTERATDNRFGGVAASQATYLIDSNNYNSMVEHKAQFT